MKKNNKRISAQTEKNTPKVSRCDSGMWALDFGGWLAFDGSRIGELDNEYYEDDINGGMWTADGSYISMDEYYEAIINRIPYHHVMVNADDIINLTPHEVTVFVGEETIKFESRGIARVAQCGKVEGLPQEQKEKCFIVSSKVRAACPKRQDLLVPTDIVRSPEGKIIGCRGFV